MTRLQILQLPEGAGDDRPPYVLVVDQADDAFRHELGDPNTPMRDAQADLAKALGARAVLVFRQSVDIPANEPLPLPLLSAETDEAERAGTTQIVYAHERTRLDLCSALLASGDTTWRKLIEHVTDRQRQLAGFLRERDVPDPKLVVLVRETLGIDNVGPAGMPYDEALHNACRQLEKSEDARAHLRSERDRLKRARNERDEPETAEGPACSEIPNCDGKCCKRRDKDQEIRSANEVIERLSAEVDEARVWARHGYESGQRHCSWSDHGVAPDWLTEGWPHHFDSCEHLARASEYDTAIGRALQVADELEEADVHGSAYDANQEAARLIRSVLRPSSGGESASVS